MNVDVHIQSGINIQVTPQTGPSYVVSNLPILVWSGQGASESWVDSGYYPRDNPSGYITSGTIGQVLKFSTTLASGVESQKIDYPVLLLNKPSAIACEIENNIDSLIYSYALLGVNTDGFIISFSDVLSSAGYTLYTTINI